MIDANMLLNPDYQNPELRAYAFLSAQYRSGVRSSVDCLEPFVIYAISATAGEQLDWKGIRSYLRTKYGIDVPYYMLDRMQHGLIEAGALKASGLPGVFLCRDARPTVAGRTVDFSIADIENLGQLLTSFAVARGLPAPATATSWPEIILPFFLHRSPPADKAIASVRGVMITDPKSVDFAFVADFIMEQYRSKSAAYKTIERLYYGVLVANFLTQIEATGDKASFKNLSIVYDAPVLLKLLGCSGNILREATEELHETLRDMGCQTYFFTHSYDELVAAIEAMVKCHENGRPLFRDTQEAITQGEITIAYIYTVRAELDLKLAALGLIEYSRRYADRESDDFQIGETAFQERLGKTGRWGTTGSLAAERDAMSLGLIMRLRDGKEVREVAKARFIFMTHNPALAIRARDFLRDEHHLSDGAVWPIMTVGQLSTIAWVANEVFQDDRRITKELIADCYAVALPDEDFDEKLRDVLMRTDPKQAHELYQNAFLAQSIRHVALGQTGGHSALVKTLNTAELVATAEMVRERTRAEAWQAGQAEAQAEVATQERERREVKVANIASVIAQIMMGVLFVACAVTWVLETGILGEAWKPDRTFLFGATVVAVYSAADLFGFTSAVSLQTLLKQGAGAAIRGLQRALA